MRKLAAFALVSMPLTAGCTCGAKPAPASVDAASSTAAAAARPGGGANTNAPSLDPGVFSAPIAAARLAGTDVVAGLVAATGVVRLMGLKDGAPAWAVDALRDVSWAPDAELRLQPAGGGVVLSWRGPHAGKTGRMLLLVGPTGEPRGEPVEIGSAFCVTTDGLAWMDPRSSGPAHVLARRWSDASPREVTTIPSDRDPALVCGEHAVLALGDGDDDLTAAAFVPGEAAAAPTIAIRDVDFGEDDEREHDAYSIGDDLGLVRVGSSGAIAMRELPRSAPATPWRRLRHSLPADDDIVAVDGDADATLIVFTHDADDACPGIGSTAESIRALRVDRRSGAETLLDLAPADCDRSPGPFWIATTPGAPTIGWVERATKLAPKAPPIAGAAFRVVRADAIRPARIDKQADFLVDAGCDERGCAVAALLRPPGGDGMQPGPIGVLSYP